MRASRRAVWVECLETRRLFAVAIGAEPGHAQATGGGSIVLASGGAAMDFLTPGTTVSNASSSVEVVFLRGDDTSGHVTVNYATANGTAVAGADYVAKSGSVQFDAGETMKSVFITLIDRPAAPAVQAFTVSLSSPSPGAYLGTQTTHTVTLQNDRAPISLATTSQTMSTDDTGVDFVVNRTGNTAIAVSVDYATANGTALAGADYQDTSGTLAFGAGETSKTVHVPLLGNRDAAADLFFGFALSSPADGALLATDSTASVEIRNFYSPVQFPSATYTVTTDYAALAVAVTRTGNTGLAATVNFATSDGTATSGDDYLPVSGTFTFAPGQLTRVINVPLLGNQEVTGDRDFNIALSSPTGSGVLGSVSSTLVTIENHYSPIHFDADGYSVNTNDTDATIAVTRSGNISGPATIDYVTSDETALDGIDYTAVSGTLTFAPGEVEKLIHVPLAGDHAAASGRHFLLSLTGGSGAAVLGSPAQAMVSIGNAYAPIQLDAFTYVGSTDDPSVTVTVTRSGNTESPVSVDYTTTDGSAVAGDDYVATSGNLSFAAGETTETIVIPLLGNFGAMDGATFGIVLSLPSGSGAELGAVDSATVTVTNTHSLVQLASSSYVADVRDGLVTLTVVRTGNTTLPASVDFATADGTALSGEDYAGTSGTLAFGPGDITQTIEVALLGDAASPASREFSLVLSAPDGNASIGDDGSATVTVENHESRVRFAHGTYAVDADDETATLTLVRTGNTALAVSVHYATADGTGVAGTDYSNSGGTVTFLAGQISRTISIPVHVHASGPAAVTFTVGLSGPAGGAVIGTTQSTAVTVTNIHSVVAFAATTYPAAESAGRLTFSLTRTGNLERPVSVGFTTSDGTAVAGSDYVGAAGTIMFAAGQSTATFDVLINSDLDFDPNETFAVSLANPTDGAVIGTAATAAVTLADTTPPPTFAGGGLVSLVKAGRLDGLSLTFDQALESAPAAGAFTLYRRAAEKSGVAPRLLPVTLTGVTYDAASHAVTVRSIKPLKAGVFYQLVVSPDGVRNQGGRMLDGAGTGQEGTPLVVTFAQGRALRYVDHDGDAVLLKLKGRGVMQLVRRTDGEGERLTVFATTPTTRLVGFVRAGKASGDGHTMLETIAGLGAATNLLSPSQFDVSAIA